MGEMRIHALDFTVEAQSREQGATCVVVADQRRTEYREQTVAVELVEKAVVARTRRERRLRSNG